MKTVWKYQITSNDYIEISLPIGAKVLSVHEQRGEVFIWILVNQEENVYETRKFRLAGTGHSISDENIKFIGTFQLYSGSFVGHLFEILE